MGKLSIMMLKVHSNKTPHNDLILYTYFRILHNYYKQTSWGRCQLTKKPTIVKYGENKDFGVFSPKLSL